MARRPTRPVNRNQNEPAISRTATRAAGERQLAAGQADADGRAQGRPDDGGEPQAPDEVAVGESEHGGGGVDEEGLAAVVRCEVDAVAAVEQLDRIHDVKDLVVLDAGRDVRQPGEQGSPGEEDHPRRRQRPPHAPFRPYSHSLNLAQHKGTNDTKDKVSRSCLGGFVLFLAAETKTPSKRRAHSLLRSTLRRSTPTSHLSAGRRWSRADGLGTCLDGGSQNGLCALHVASFTLDESAAQAGICATMLRGSRRLPGDHRAVPSPLWMSVQFGSVVNVRLRRRTQVASIA